MSLTINWESFQGLIRDDLQWLMLQPRSLERDHLEDILKTMLRCDSYQEYGEVFTLISRRRDNA